ncbi:MAG: 16S rRNA (guanine(527)-N(7))-methyltransferase RsmG [Oscillospiraceae bacterium]|nr:16S rRNA (guanine(527)-N(7))-methyltransferase RsmG [Oscillospiraceae bacterium]
MNYVFSERETFLLNKMSKLMLEYNAKVNLTRITQNDEIFEKHYIDSALPLELLHDVPRGTSIIDIGTGAGFPGVVLKIARPDLELTLVDSLKKRTTYLEFLKAELGLDFSIIHARSEELSRKDEFREKFDVGISRAVANLSALVEYVLPLVKVGGLFAAMKGERDETAEATTAIKTLGGKVEEVFRYALPSGDKRSLVVIRKISQTPTQYPRNRVNISKNPL